MKKAIIILFLIALTSPSVFSQPTYPGYTKMLDSTSWRYRVCFHLCINPEFIWYHTTGDTTIASKNYMIIEHTSTNAAFLTFVSRKQFLREDTWDRKVYYYDQNSATEKLLYDFSLKVGDSIMQPHYVLSPKYMRVVKIDTFLSAWGSRRRIWFDSVGSFGVSLIEGVGFQKMSWESDLRVFDPAWYFAYHHQLMGCIYQNGIEAWKDTTQTACPCASMCPSLGSADTLWSSSDTICRNDSLLLMGPCDTSMHWSTSLSNLPFGQNQDSIWVHPNASQTFYWHGSMKTDSIKVVVLKPPSIDLGPDLVGCQGDTFLLDPINSKGRLTYKWSNGTSDSTIRLNYSTNLWLKVTDTMGCIDLDTIKITINAIPTIQVIDSILEIRVDSGPLALNNCLPMGGVYSGSGVSNNIFDPTSSGVGLHNIRYSYRDSNNCIDSVKFEIRVYDFSLVSENKINKELHVVPNPSSGSFTLILPDDHSIYLVNIRDMSGRLIESKISRSSNSIRFNLNENQGIYFIEVYADDKYIGASKLLVD